MKKTVLILGAGSSADYGYPLWYALKKEVLAFDINRDLAGLHLSQNEIASHKAAFEEFKKYLDREPDATLDRLVFLIDQPKSKHLSPTGHLILNLAGYLLVQVERQGLDGLWVSEFQTLLVDYLASLSGQAGTGQNHLQNLTIVSLNYDRVFEHFVSAGFYKKLCAHPEYNPPDQRFSSIFHTKMCSQY